MKILSKLLILTVIFLSFGVCAKEVKMIFMTDINLNQKNAYKFQETIKEINSYKDVDFVVFGGNNIARANVENLNLLTYLIKKVNKKTYVLLGSSDVLSSNAIDKKYYMKRIARAEFRHSKKPNYVFKKNNYIFVAMDGSKQYFQSTNGYYTKEELAWLKKTLDKYKDKNIIILQHFPLLETSSQWLQTAKTEDYINLLKNYNNVKVIISGHYDENKELKKDGIYHIITESYSNSGAYKIIEIDLDYDFIATYLVKD